MNSDARKLEALRKFAEATRELEAVMDAADPLLDCGYPSELYSFAEFAVDVTTWEQAVSRVVNAEMP